MAKTLQFRRGTTGELSSVTGAVGELFVDTTKDTVVVMDGSTAGGFALQRELVSGTNIKTINGSSILGSGDIGTYQFSVAADDSTQRVVSTDEVIKFIGAGGITTASDEEGNITITGSGGGVSSGGTVTTLTIGDVYYENNIVSPIPIISTTSYGTVTTVPPLVVNGPLSVLSAATDATSLLFTMSGDQTSGGESGGTNNSGAIYTNGVVEFRFPYGAANGGKELLATVRVGDIITAIGANGVFTGSKTFTVSRVSIVDNGVGEAPGYISILGLVDTPPGSDEGFNANIITCYRPNTTSTFVGGISSKFLSADQVVAKDISATGSLSINKTLFTGATEKRHPGALQPTLSASTNLILPYRINDYLSVTAYAGSAGYGFTSVYLNLNLHSELAERTLTLRVQPINNDVTWNLPQADWDIIVYRGDDDENSITTTTTVKWTGGVSSGTLTVGRIYQFTFKVQLTLIRVRYTYADAFTPTCTYYVTVYL
jgi:hypothetical protein